MAVQVGFIDAKLIVKVLISDDLVLVLVILNLLRCQ